MNVEIIVLRLLHIIAGVFWVGAVLFIVVVLDPKLRTLGPDVQHKIYKAIGGQISAVLGVSSAVTILAGIALALRLRWGHLDTFFNTGWGYAILVGFIAAVVAAILGGMSEATSRRLVLLYESDSGNDTAAFQKSDKRLAVLYRLYAIFVLIAVASMASARFI